MTAPVGPMYRLFDEMGVHVGYLPLINFPEKAHEGPLGGVPLAYVTTDDRVAIVILHNGLSGLYMSSTWPAYRDIIGFQPWQKL